MPNAQTSRYKDDPWWRSQTFFEFVSFLDRDQNEPHVSMGHYSYETMMGTFTENSRVFSNWGNYTDTDGFLTTITVNTASYAFEELLKTCRGFELGLLHAMIHIKNIYEGNLGFKYLYENFSDYASACELLAGCYENILSFLIECLLFR